MIPDNNEEKQPAEHSLWERSFGAVSSALKEVMPLYWTARRSSGTALKLILASAKFTPPELDTALQQASDQNKELLKSHIDARLIADIKKHENIEGWLELHYIDAPQAVIAACDADDEKVVEAIIERKIYNGNTYGHKPDFPEKIIKKQYADAFAKLVDRRYPVDCSSSTILGCIPEQPGISPRQAAMFKSLMLSLRQDPRRLGDLLSQVIKHQYTDSFVNHLIRLDPETISFVFLECIDIGCNELIEKLVANVKDWGIFDPNSQSIFHAARVGNLDMLGLLLDEGAKCDTTGERELIVSVVCAMQRDIENNIQHGNKRRYEDQEYIAMVKRLYALGYHDFPFLEGGYPNALSLSAAIGNVELLRAILENNIGEEEDRMHKLSVALDSAVEKGHLAAIELLLLHGADKFYNSDQPNKSVMKTVNNKIAQASSDAERYKFQQCKQLLEYWANDKPQMLALTLGFHHRVGAGSAVYRALGADQNGMLKHPLGEKRVLEIADKLLYEEEALDLSHEAACHRVYERGRAVGARIAALEQGNVVIGGEPTPVTADAAAVRTHNQGAAVGGV